MKKPVSEVQVLTPSNFDDLVKNSGKTVFVKFYAPVPPFPPFSPSGAATADTWLPPGKSWALSSPKNPPY